MFDKISETFGVANITEESPKGELVVSEPASTVDMDDDFEFARTTIKTTIEKTTDALDEMIELAKASEHPRAFEVLNQISSNIASMSEQLIKLHKDKQKTKDSGAAKSVVNNSLYVSSAEDLIKMINDKRKSENGSN